MGISAGGDRNAPKSDMNVTPMVDVVLVLLVIFLVAMPVVMRSITIEVPRELKDDEIVVTTSTSITILGRADGSVQIHDGTGDSVINRVDLAKTVRSLLESKKTQKVVFVDFEDPVKYSDAIGIMDTIRGAAPRNAEGEPDVKVALKTRKKGQ